MTLVQGWGVAGEVVFHGISVIGNHGRKSWSIGVNFGRKSGSKGVNFGQKSVFFGVCTKVSKVCSEILPIFRPL